MYNGVKEIKPFSIIQMIGSEAIILYGVLIIGDALRKANLSSMFLTRYLPIAIVTIIMLYFLIKRGAKRCPKNEQMTYIKKIMIAQVVLAVILLIFGLISVNQKVSKLEKTMDLYTSYRSTYEKGTSASNIEKLEEILNEAKKEATNSWIISAFTFLICAEGMTLFMDRRIYGIYGEDLEQVEHYNSYDMNNIEQNENSNFYMKGDLFSENEHEKKNDEFTNNIINGPF